jgi:hypothetical protein
MIKAALLLLLIGMWSNPGMLAQISLESFASGFTRPVDIAHAGDGSGRLFVVEQAGIIRIVDKLEQIVSIPFLDIQTKVDDSDNEEGLLGLAFDPDYKNNGYFYVNYVNSNSGRKSIIERYTVSADSNLVNTNSGVVILSIDQFASNHNGGDINFGPDGYLYIATGDGGGGGDPGEHGQNMNSLLGKLLRIDVSSLPYTIPTDNPFIDAQDTMPEIWSYGLRNPWRFSFDRKNGALWIADVGQGDWEEINFADSLDRGGQNYGWDCLEGNHSFENTDCAGLTFTAPIYEYGHGTGRSITGGYVLRSRHYNNFTGQYIFADYVTNKVWLLQQYQNQTVSVSEVTPGISRISTFGQDEEGRIYAASLSEGTIYQLVESGLFPIELISFSILRQEKRVLLEWETGIELDASHFEIEKRKNNGGFQSIGIIPVKGTEYNDKTMYQFEDPVYKPGKYQYRLKSIDLDGSFSYSMIRHIEITDLTDLQIKPNPAKDIIHIHVPQKFEAGIIEIFNLGGQVLQSKNITIQLRENIHDIELDVSQLDHGLILVRFSSEDAIFTKKVMLYP